MKPITVMKRVTRFLLFALLAICPPVSGQEPEKKEGSQGAFRNPALENLDEHEKALFEARALARKGEPEQALEQYRKAARLREDKCIECFQSMGQIYFYLGKYKEAAAAFRQALALKPDNEAELSNGLGVSLYLQNDKKALEESVAALRRSIDLSGGKVKKAYHTLGFALIKLNREQEGITALKTYLELDPNSANAYQARAVIKNPRLVNERFAAGFKVTANTGEELSLEKLHGKIVLLDFWAVWCAPCIKEMPELKKIWEKFRNDKFVIVGVSLDQSRKAFESFIAKEGITWPQFFDGRGWDNAISALYKVRAIPHTVLIDQDGIVRAEGLSGGPLANKIEDLLKKLHKREGAGGR